jgi:hypothetical protein
MKKMRCIVNEILERIEKENLSIVVNEDVSYSLNKSMQETARDYNIKNAKSRQNASRSYVTIQT